MRTIAYRCSAPRDELIAIVNFVRKYCRNSENCKLVITDHERSGYRCAGLAYPKDPIGYPGDETMLARVWVNVKAEYPFTDDHIKDMPPVTYEDWQQEVVVVVAHELVHIAQFGGVGQNVYECPESSEIEAETIAREVLEHWRQHVWLKNYMPTKVSK